MKSCRKNEQKPRHNCDDIFIQNFYSDLIIINERILICKINSNGFNSLVTYFFFFGLSQSLLIC